MKIGNIFTNQTHPYLLSKTEMIKKKMEEEEEDKIHIRIISLNNIFSYSLYLFLLKISNNLRP